MTKRSVTSLLLLLSSCFISGEELGEVYMVTIGPEVAKTVTFPSNSTNKPVRIVVDSPDANVSHPLLITVSQGSRLVVIQLPTLLQGIPYTKAERTLCPPCPGMDSCPPFPVTVVFMPYLDVNITVSLSVFLVDNYYLSAHNPITLTAAPNAPQHFMFLLANVSDVVVKYTSDNTQCAVVSVQYGTCPDDSSSTPLGTYQWMERLGAITTTRKRGDTAQHLYAVVAVFPGGTTSSCSSESASLLSISSVSSLVGSKNVTLEVSEALSDLSYAVGVLVPTVVFMSSYIVAFLWIVVFDWIRFHYGSVFKLLKLYRHGSNQLQQDPKMGRELHGRDQVDMGKIEDQVDVGKMEDQVDVGTAAVRRPGLLSVFRGSYSMEMMEPISRIELSRWSDQQDGGRSRGVRKAIADHDDDLGGTHDDHNGTHDDTDGTHDDHGGIHDDHAGEHQDHYGYIGQLRFSESMQPDNHYVWFLLSMVILYGIPAYQLAMTYQEQFVTSGAQDSCFYNFLCSHPLQVTSSFSLAAFNNVYSNIGYVILGVLVLLLNHRRRNIHRAFERTNENLAAEEKLGVPTHFGIYYAAGMALMAIGAMSAAYHMCPSRRNYQFDTTFMYVLAGLAMYRLLKARNPDITPRMHYVMFALATLILLVVIGGLYAPLNAGWPIYTLFSAIYLLVCLILTVEIYYRWTITGWLSVKTRLYQLKCPPNHKPKFVMAIVMMLLNVVILLYGFASRPSDFATYLLAIMIANLVLLLGYYFTVKCIYLEWKVDWDSVRPISYFLLSIIFWAIGIYFYMNAGTNWLETPAGSRNGNVECLALKFYDYHDCWHFASACALFFTILMLMALDDQQRLTQRSALKVF